MYMMLTFPILTSKVGIAGTFYIIAGVTALSCGWLYVYVPETKGKSLEQIETDFREAGEVNLPLLIAP